jgi:hypothetical protein
LALDDRMMAQQAFEKPGLRGHGSTLTATLAVALFRNRHLVPSKHFVDQLDETYRLLLQLSSLAAHAISDRLISQQGVEPMCNAVQRGSN